MEIWKDIIGYEGIYQVSSLGNVKSLERLDSTGRHLKGKLKKQSFDDKGYYQLSLSKNGVAKTRKVHQLVAESFLNHTKCGYNLVVNHINLNPQDNCIDNLEIVTQRDNANKKHIISTSKYTGVCWSKEKRKWRASINLKYKQSHLGYFNNEHEAHLAYKKALSEIKN